jgi:hypothetical protein
MTPSSEVIFEHVLRALGLTVEQAVNPKGTLIRRRRSIVPWLMREFGVGVLDICDLMLVSPSWVNYVIRELNKEPGSRATPAVEALRVVTITLIDDGYRGPWSQHVRKGRSSRREK